ncbi:MAG: outer membrane beta-barrel protein [Rhizobiales bacterium]|nr:outer membrane beta-barrel protein [Hyphomicrobiales bacterium]
MAAIPYPERKRPTADQNPYQPVGVDVGGLRLRPYVEADGGYDDNPNRAAGAHKGSGFVRAAAGFEAASQWARHEFKASLRGGYSHFANISGADRPDAQGAMSLRLDALRDTQVLLDANVSIDTQRPGSPEITSIGTVGATLKNRPIVATYGAGVGVTQRFNRLEASLRGSVDRTSYQNGDLSDGTTLKLEGQSYNTYALRGRLAYEVSPGFKPFVEATVDARKHDDRVDSSGFRRDSTGVTGKAGASLELTRLVTGEASVGYSERNYDDSRLGKLRGPVFDAALIWTATPLTTVTLKGSTALNETTVANATGSVARKGSIEISHALLRNLTIAGGLAYGETSYRGVDLTEKTLAATLRADYNITRSVVVRGSFTHERLKSTAANSDYTANAFLLGLRLQR